MALRRGTQVCHGARLGPGPLLKRQRSLPVFSRRLQHRARQRRENPRRSRNARAERRQELQLSESPKAGADLEPTKRSVSDLTPDGALLSPDPHFVLSKQHNVLLIMNSSVSPVLNTGAPSRSAALYKLSAAADSGPAGSVLAASVLLACNGIIPLTQSQLDIHYSAQVSEQTGCGKPPPGTRILGESCV